MHKDWGLELMRASRLHTARVSCWFQSSRASASVSEAPSVISKKLVGDYSRSKLTSLSLSQGPSVPTEVAHRVGVGLTLNNLSHPKPQKGVTHRVNSL